MGKKLKVFLLLFLILISIVSIANAVPSINAWENTVELEEDGSSKWEVGLNYSEPMEKSNYFIFANIYDVSVFTLSEKRLDCDLNFKEVGSLIVCDNLSSYNITKIIYKFKSNNQVSNFNEFRMFRHGMSITENLNYFSITVKLPLGSTIVDKSKLKGTRIVPFEPAYGEEGSDGRRIFVRWELNKPRLGEPINIAILYESLPFGLELGFVISILLVVIIISILATYYFKKIRFDIKSVLSVLSDGERKVMEIIIREKRVDQRIIVRETDFSKAKVSRIMQSLASRGLIDAIPRGRTKLITLIDQKKSFIKSISQIKTSYKVSSLRLSKEQALELIRFINTVIDHLNIELKDLQSKEYTKTKRIKIPQKLNILYEDIEKLYPNVNNRVEEHNKHVDNLEKIVAKIKSAINKKFGNKFESMLKENGLDEYHYKDFSEFIINNKNQINTQYSAFWEANKNKILKVRESKPIKTSIKDMETSSEELERNIWDFLEELKKIREDIRKSHNILVNEF